MNYGCFNYWFLIDGSVVYLGSMKSDVVVMTMSFRYLVFRVYRIVLYYKELFYLRCLCC